MQKFPVPAIYDALEMIMEYYPEKFDAQKKTELETLLDHCLLGLEESSNKLLTTLFIKALKNHIGPTSIDEHIYLKKFDLPQIQLFDLLIKHFPFVSKAHEITNYLLAKKIIGFENVLLIDIGIGRGIQTVSLLKDLKIIKDHKLKKLKILGIEPFKDALENAEKTIKEAAADLNCEFEFISWNKMIEEISLADFENLISSETNVIINESLTLHHIQHSNDRDRVLKELYKLKPVSFLLTEPNVDHFEPSFQKRFRNCYQHFYHVFQVIDNLEISKHEQNALKLFFGREIDDIIGKHEHDRYERHEPAVKWISRLKKAGFRIKSKFEYPYLNGIQNFKIEATNNFLGFTYKEETVLSIIYAES